MQAVSLLCALGLLISAPAHAATASWFSRESCLREGTSGIMANGMKLEDDYLICASWDYPLGTWLRVRANGKEVIVIVADRGPNRALYRQGRVLDLSARAFKRLSPLSAGLVELDSVEVLS